MILLRDRIARIRRRTFIKNPFGRLISILLSVVLNIEGLKGKRLHISKVIEGSKGILLDNTEDDITDLTIMEPQTTIPSPPPSSPKPTSTSTLISFPYIPNYRLRVKGDQSVKILPISKTVHDTLPESEILRKEKSKMTQEELIADKKAKKNFVTLSEPRINLPPAFKPKETQKKPKTVKSIEKEPSKEPSKEPQEH